MNNEFITKATLIILFFFHYSSGSSQTPTVNEITRLLARETPIGDSIVNLFNFTGAAETFIYDEKTGVQIEYYFQRELEIGMRQYLLAYLDLSDFEEYSLVICQWRGKLLLSRFSKKSFGDNRQEILFEHVSGHMNDYLIEYNELKHANIKTRHLSNGYFFAYEFGLACSIAGTMPEKTAQMVKLVKNKNIDQLRIHLNSLNINMRLYGALGLKWIEYDGVTLTPEDDKKIRDLLSDEYVVNHCSGCIVSNAKISDVVGANWLKSDFLGYKKLGWLDKE